MFKNITLALALVFATAITTGCEKKEGSEHGHEHGENGHEHKEEVNTTPPAESTPEVETTPTAKVEVAAKGQKFDPAIKPEQLPSGAWYCDMGTVHWAATEKPENGKCPECGMMLKQYDPGAHAKQKEKAVEADHDHGDHEHGEHGDHEHGEHGHEH